MITFYAAERRAVITMFIDYLDPFWPVRSPESPVDRSDRPTRELQQPVRRPEDESYEERGEQIDQYA